MKIPEARTSSGATIMAQGEVKGPGPATFRGPKWHNTTGPPSIRHQRIVDPSRKLQKSRLQSYRLCAAPKLVLCHRNQRGNPLISGLKKLGHARDSKIKSLIIIELSCCRTALKETGSTEARLPSECAVSSQTKRA